MNKIFIVFFCLVSAYFFSCKKDKINNNFDVYGLYIAKDTSQYIQRINFAEPFIQTWYKDSSEVKYLNYEIINNDVFSDSLMIFQILDFDKNNSIELFHVDSMRIINFPPRK